MALATLRTDREIWTIGRNQGRFLRAITVRTAKAVLVEDQRKGRFPNTKDEFLTVVDNKLGAPEETVKFGGTIVYQSNAADITEILEWIRNQLFNISPIGKKRSIDRRIGGWRAHHYEDAHLLLVNGRSPLRLDETTNIVAFQRGLQAAKHTKGSDYQIVNTMPYAKRIESRSVATWRNGRVNTISPWSMQAPNGVYRRVARAAKQRFGETVNIRYALLPLNLGKTIMGSGGVRISALYPAIIIRSKSVTRGLS